MRERGGRNRWEKRRNLLGKEVEIDREGGRERQREREIERDSERVKKVDSESGT